METRLIYLKYKNSKSDIVLIGIAYTTVIILTFSIIIPFLLIFLQSITPRRAMSGEWYSIIPKQVTFDAYVYLLVSSRLIAKAFKNSLFFGGSWRRPFSYSNNYGSIHTFQTIFAI
jgi:ABC-type glycerol-3-phosphate transport system permease component